MRRDHSSFSAFLDCATSETAARGLNYSRSNGFKFTGTASWESAVHLARTGWADGRAEIEKHRAAFSALIGDRVRRPVLSHDMAGFAPDVGAFLQGEPESMFSREFVDANAPGRILRVVVNGTVSADISRSSIIRRGALICALVDAIESAGYSCELTACFCAKDGRQTATDFIPVKAAGEALEVDRIAYVFAHPSMLRRMIFAAWEQDLPFINEAGPSYGFPTDVPESDRGDLYFGRVFSGEVRDAEVLPWFKAQLEPLGITFDE